MSDHDPREHRAGLDADGTLCGVPVLIEIAHDGRLVQCPECAAIARQNRSQ
ncbi:hypothetical protein [Nocardioides sp.]|uniref:hypothetical protein n=1 Tax=Nocardioides sp. TaxID=35761 RepID=UPI003D0C9200